MYMIERKHQGGYETYKKLGFVYIHIYVKEGVYEEHIELGVYICIQEEMK